MKRTIVFRPERCLLCLSCELACQVKALGAHDQRALAQGERPSRRITITLAEGTPRASICRHCAQAPCVEACISGSIIRDEETSAVRHSPETCVGCGTCQLVCPFNAITRNDREDRMEKCNLCPDEETPPCVGACQTGALAVGRSDRGAQEKKRNFAKGLRGEIMNSATQHIECHAGPDPASRSITGSRLSPGRRLDSGFRRNDDFDIYCRRSNNHG